MWKQKRFRLALVIFLPLLLLVSVFSVIVYSLYQKQINTIDEYFSDQAFEIQDVSEEEEFLNQILTDEDWEILSMAEIDALIEAAGHSPIGDPNDPFYFLSPQEIDQQYETFLQENERVTKNPEVLFLDPLLTEDLGGYEELGLPPYISLEQIQALEESISEHSLWTIIILLGVAASVLGVMAWFLALKSFKPLELSLQKQKEFVAHVSHELRTPLSMIKTEAEVLLKSPLKLPVEAKKFTQNIIQDIGHMNDLSTQLLQLSKIDSQQVKTKVTSKIDTDWKQLQKRFKTRSIQEEKSLNMSDIKKVSLCEPVIGCKTIIQIILDNAFKYTKNGDKITVTTKDSQKEFIVAVRDNGIGIDKKDLPHIFDRFYRADKSRNTSGFGLGLSLAKDALVSIGGDIQVDSIVNKGSEFRIIFPKQ